MKHVFLLLIQVALNHAGVSPPDYNTFASIVPAKFRDGHRYYLEVDNVGERRIYKPIAVYAMRKEVLFGEFNASSGCATFASHRNVIQKCDHQFFLLHGDFKKYERVYLAYWLGKGKLNCKVVEFAENVPLLVKYDVTDNESPKAIGTYSKDRDGGYIINHLNEKVSYRYIKKRVILKHYPGAKFEPCSEIYGRPAIDNSTIDICRCTAASHYVKAK